MAISVKERRQLLVQKKEARVLKMLQLGEKIHKQLMLGTVEETDLKSDSAEILSLDKEIYTLSKSIIEQTQNQEKCTKCQGPILPNIKFCGQCGQLNSNYIDEAAIKKQCLICEELIDEEVAFCPCCGTEQGGV